MLIVGFGHKARQGKNSAAVAFINAAPLGKEVRLYAYADSLRAEVNHAINVAGGAEELIEKGVPCSYRSAVCGPRYWRCLECGKEWDSIDFPKWFDGHPRIIPDWVVAEKGKPRTLLQWWGTDYRRAQDPNYWVKQFKERLKKDNPDVALVTDVRFENEAEAIHDLGGYLVKVTRTTEPDIEVPMHPSESMLDDYSRWDFEIKAANLGELKKQAVAIYKKVAK